MEYNKYGYLMNFSYTLFIIYIYHRKYHFCLLTFLSPPPTLCSHSLFPTKNSHKDKNLDSSTSCYSLDLLATVSNPSRRFHTFETFFFTIFTLYFLARLNLLYYGQVFPSYLRHSYEAYSRQFRMYSGSF